MPTRSRPKIAIVGAGNLGSALAVCLQASGYVVSEVVSRDLQLSKRRAAVLARKVGARTTGMSKPEITADLVWFCVPDRAIASAARELADSVVWKGKVAVHSSGVLSSNELAALQKGGASVVSAHPLMTFVPGVTPSLVGVGFAVEGHARARRAVGGIIAALKGEMFSIRRKDKAGYHAWGTFASPLVTALLALSERVAQAAGVSRAESRRRVLPIVRQTVENYATQGAALGFSGPIVRGDAATIRRHLRVLKKVPGAADVYRAIALAALANLPARNRKQLARILRGTR